MAQGCALAGLRIHAILCSKKARMDVIVSLLPIAQILLGLLLIAGILLQQRGAGLGGAFGGDSGAETFSTRRGAEKIIFQATIVIAVLFVLSAVVALIV